jgi:hypothetical protein
MKKTLVQMMTLIINGFFPNLFFKKILLIEKKSRYFYKK